MRYLIITTSNNPFYTDYYNYENHYSPMQILCIFDLTRQMHTFDGKTWVETEIDHLVSILVSNGLGD